VVSICKNSRVVALVSMLLISLFSPAKEREGDDSAVKDTLQTTYIRGSYKQMLPLEKLSVPVTQVFMKDMENRGINSPRGFSAVVPNLYIPDYGSAMTSSIYMRGFGSRIDNPVIGLYIDDIPILNKNSYDFNMLDIRMADMLRGPQGTLYGRNSMCGVLELTSLSPKDYDGVRVSVETGLNFPQSASVSADWAAKVSLYKRDKKGLGYSFLMSYKGSNGVYQNAYKMGNGDDSFLDPSHSLSFRNHLTKQLRGDLDFENIIMFSVLTQGGWPYRQSLLDDSGNQYLAPVSYNDTCSYKRLNFTDGLKFRLTRPNYTISSVTSLQLLMDEMILDQDFTSASMFTMAQRQREGAITQDIIFKPTGEWERPWWNSQTGLFAFYKFNSMSAPVNFKQDGIQGLILDNANAGMATGGVDGEIKFKESEFTISSDFGIHTYGIALYHESYFKLNNWLLTAGFRVDYEGNNMVYNSNATVNYRLTTTMPSFKPYNCSYIGAIPNHYVEFIPKVSALYDFSDFLGEGDRWNIFATIAKGYKSGGFNTQIFSDILQNRMMNGLMADLGVYLDKPSGSVTAENTTYKPEESYNFELGTKFDLALMDAKHRVYGSASVYYIDCINQQITLFPPGQSTGRMMANVGRSRSYGVEAELGYRLKGFTMNLAYGYTNAKFVKYDDGNNNYSGNFIPYSPQNTVSARFSYQFDFGSSIFKSLSIAADYTGIGDIYWDEANLYREPYYNLLGADIVANLKWFSLRLRGDNLTATQYRTFYFKSVGNSFFQTSRPTRCAISILFNL
jgi:outer membrane receptor protein involved in Fe transport